MNIYHPYEVISDTQDCLHLKESETRERIDFVMRRVLPIFLLFFTWFLLQDLGDEMPASVGFVLVSAMLLISGILFFRTYITEIKIVPKKEIYFVKKTITGTREQTLAVGDIEKIVLKRRKGRAAGAFFRLQTRTNRSYWILRIPLLYVDNHHVALVKERLQDMLNTTVEGD